MSENESPRSPLDQAVDLLFYAPIGLLANAEEVVGDLVRRGRQQVAVAKVFGELAVKQGQKEAVKLAGRAQDEVLNLVDQLLAKGRPGDDDLQSPHGPDTGSDVDAGSHGAMTVEADFFEETGIQPDSDLGLDVVPGDATDPVDDAIADGTPLDADALAIPGYDSLSASQVVPRLVSLAPDELEAIRRYEKLGRGRKTILHRIAQLQSGA